MGKATAAGARMGIKAMRMSTMDAQVLSALKTYKFDKMILIKQYMTKICCYFLSDIDECLHNNTNPCTDRGATCQNTPRNYTCSCPPGKKMVNNMCMANQKSSSWVMPVIGTSYISSCCIQQ
jgi:hypothetical protein